MTSYDFFQEQIVPFFKTDYQNFDSKKVGGYEVFKAKWDKKEREAMVNADTLQLLRRIQEKFVTSTKYKEEDLDKSQIGRWYINGFTMAYNYCRRYDLNHPHQQTEFIEFAKKLKSSEDLEEGEWDVDKFRKHTINLGRHEGTLFYMAEKSDSQEKPDASQPGVIDNEVSEEKLPTPITRELPPELQTDEARVVLDKAISAGLCDSDYHWLKTKILLSYFADCASLALHLSKAQQDDKEKVNWKPFEKRFGYSDLAGGKNTYSNKTGKLPNEHELVDSIFE